MFFRAKQSAYAFLIVGLGNPGREYENTRHNAGFLTADILAERFATGEFKQQRKALVCDCKIGENRVLLAKPQTFMNLSGDAVAALAKFYKIPTEKIIVIFDDISLPVGKVRVRAGGTHGGHNGMKNISERIGSNEIKRVKIGVGEKPHPDYDLKDWVLGKFPKAELAAAENGFARAADAVECIVKADIVSAMNKFNG